MSDICHKCGKNYKKIGIHWSKSSTCNHKELSNEQRDIAVGLLMGDGCTTGHKSGNPRLQCSMISINYLKYLDKQFGVLSNGVRLDRTAKQKADENARTGFSVDAKEENYSDLYMWRSMHHPELEEFSNWYSSGNKVWPESINLTPTVLKHWYCGDGSWNNYGHNNHISIASSNEIDNKNKVEEMFIESGLPSPSSYSKNEILFTVSDSKELWEYMGQPLPDFGYKWPKIYR